MPYRNFLQFFLILLSSLIINTIYARSIPLTLEKAVDIAVNGSYRTKAIELGIQRSRHFLRARQASLKTQVYLNLQTPDIQNVSESKWNSVTQRDDIVQLNKQKWQSDLAVRYPISMLGYPTNGYLSLNYKVYKYIQEEAGMADYYNRLYLKFEQPFLLPNELKNNLEEAELDLEDVNLDYVGDRMSIVVDISNDYYEIFQLTYFEQIYEKQIDYLKKAEVILKKEPANHSRKSIEKDQIQLEISNLQEMQLTNRSRLRRELVLLRQRLRLTEEDSIYVLPRIHLKSIEVDLNKAIALGYENSPYIQRLRIRRRRSELAVAREKGRNAFHLKLEMTYGLEKGNHHFESLWQDYENSNSVTLNAYVPIWDGGNRSERIQAQKLSVAQRDLQIDEEQDDIKNTIITAYTNLNEYYNRSEHMYESLKLAEQVSETSINKFQNSEISFQNLLQILEMTMKTHENFIDIYVDYRLALLDLKRETFYDFEKNISVVDSYKYN